MNMFIVVRRVLAAVACGTAAAMAVWVGVGSIEPLRSQVVWPWEWIGCWFLGFFAALLGVAFAGPPGLRGRVKGAFAGGLAGIPLTLITGPIGVIWWMLPLGIAGGIAAAVFPRELVTAGGRP